MSKLITVSAYSRKGPLEINCKNTKVPVPVPPSRVMMLKNILKLTAMRTDQFRYRTRTVLTDLLYFRPGKCDLDPNLVHLPGHCEHWPGC
jgi:hypothetical protein